MHSPLLLGIFGYVATHAIATTWHIMFGLAFLDHMMLSSTTMMKQGLMSLKNRYMATVNYFYLCSFSLRDSSPVVMALCFEETK